MTYLRKYGPYNIKPDFSRCCEEIQDRSGWGQSHQCNRKNGHGPEGHYCKQHDPEAVAAKKREREAKQEIEWRNYRLAIHGAKFFAALQEIANGHNDPRKLATDAIAEFEKGR